MVPVLGIFLRGAKRYIKHSIDVDSIATTDNVIFGDSLPAGTGRLWRLFSLLSVTLLASSILCGCAGFVLRASPASPDSHRLAVTPGTLDFGSVPLNSTMTQSVTLASIGTGSVTVDSAVLSEASFAMSGVTFPLTLGAGQSEVLNVTFKPTTSAASSGVLSISSNSEDSNTATVHVTGTGVATPVPRLTLSATSLSFGNVTVNSPATEAITLKSTGTEPVMVNGAGVSGSGYTVSGSTFPMSLDPGSSLTLQVTFDPKTAGASAGTLTISSNANPTTISLSGTGVTMPVPQLTTSATSLSFGNVTVNSTATETITLKSTGTEPVTVNGAGVSGSGYTVSGSTFPVSLNPGMSLTLQVTFDPKTAGVSEGILTINSNANPAIVSLSGTGVAAPVPQLTASATSLSFGNVTVNSTATETITLKSSGTAPVRVNGAGVSGTGYTVSGSTFPVTLNPGVSLTLQVTFDPKTAGASAGTLTIGSNANAITVSLSGTGVATLVPRLTTSATSLSFGNVTVNSTATETITLKSAGTGPVTVNGAGVSGTGFAVSGSTFPVSLNPGSSLTLQVTFDPKTAGASAGTLTISSNANAITVSLSGTGVAAPVPQLTVSPTSLSFGNVTVNSTATQTITLKSTGTGPVTLSGVSVSGSGFSTASIALPLKLNPGQTLNLQINFTPTVSGAATGSLVVTSDSSSNARATVSLSGTGASASNPVLTISATSLDFGNTVIASSATQILTLTSTGPSPVTVSNASVTGSGFTISGLTFPVTLNPTIAVKLTVVFTPVAAGTSTGQLTITSNSTSGSTALVSLSGTGTAAHSANLTWSAPVNSPVAISGYRVYRADSNGSFTLLNTSIVTQTSYPDHSVQSGTTYHYYVTSVDAADVESSPSNQIILTIP
jgi:Abnormal spindle-like microcephaly-assoc'd, ASPM-SPD-2-Hydin